MALCEVCGKDVAPGDLFKLVEGTKVRFFCSPAHLSEGRAATEEPKEAWEKPDEPEIPGQTNLETVIKEEETQEKKDAALICSVCGFEAKTKGGLGAHVRSKHK